MTWVEDLTASAADHDSSEAIAWARRNGVLATAIALIVAGLCEKAIVLAHGYFRQDDFYLFEVALRSKFNWHLLGSVYAGHFTPGGLALAWALAHVSLYNWTLASVVNLALFGAASVALFRLLRGVFGNRPAILIPLLVYVFCPLAVPGLTFWATTISWLPAQLAIVMALDAHLRYVRGGRFWHAAAAAAWFLFGLLFDEAAAFIPVLLLAATSAFFMADGWGRAARAAVRRYWRAWVLYLIVEAGYVVVLVLQARVSVPGPGSPSPLSNILTFLSTVLRVSFVPSALGGPWHWYSVGPYAYADWVSWLTPLSWCVAGFIVLASLWYRRFAWRSWAILALWVILTAMAQLFLRRGGLASPVILGEDLHYLADGMPVLAICLGLAFLPVQGEGNAYRARNWRLPRQAAILVVLAGFIAGSLYSVSSYLAGTSSAPEASYVATARAALGQIPAGTVIWSTPVPPLVQQPQWYGRYASTQLLIGLMAPAAEHLGWTKAPTGVIRHLMIFDRSGRLWGVVLNGRTIQAPAKRLGCWSVTTRTVRIPLGSATPYPWSWELSMWYSGPAATMAVGFAGTWHDVPLPAGEHELWLPVPGSGNSLQARLLTPGVTECVSSVTIGAEAEPSDLSKPVPAVPVPG